VWNTVRARMVSAATPWQECCAYPALRQPYELTYDETGNAVRATSGRNAALETGNQMASKDDTSDNENDLFKQATDNVRPLKQDRITPTPKHTKPIPKKTLEDEQQVMDSLLSDEWEPGEVESGEELLFSRPGIQKSVFRKLRTGKYVVEAELDLHGMFAKDARQFVAGFISESQARGLRCVRIIHGKGLSSPNKMPVLKNKVNQWLQLMDAVLAFSSALPGDGGTGAVYILLKRR